MRRAANPGWWRWALRVLITGVSLGVLAGFVGSLLRRRSLVRTTGYVPPVAAVGRRAVPPPPGTTLDLPISPINH